MLVAASRFIERREQLLAPSELISQVQKSRNLVIATSMNALNIESLQALAIVAFSDVSRHPKAIHQAIRPKIYEPR